MHNLDLYKLEIFLLVVERGSFSGAADHLLMSQPAISQHMHEMEAQLGATLFVRGRRGVALTPAGQTLHDYAVRILALVTEAEQAVTNVSQIASGQVHMGATPGLSAYVIPPLIMQFRAAYPRLNVHVHTATTPQIVESLRQGTIEMAVVEGELPPTPAVVLEVALLHEEEQIVVVGPDHPWRRRGTLALAELDGQPMVVRQAQSQTYQWLSGALQAAGVHPHFVAEFDSLESIKRAVMSGGSLAVLPLYAVQPEQHMGVLHVLHVTEHPLTRTIKMVWRHDARLSPVARTLAALLRHHIGE